MAKMKLPPIPPATEHSTVGWKPPAPPTGRIMEFLVLPRSHMTHAAREDGLNELGALGWSLVAVEAHTLYLQREKPDVAPNGRTVSAPDAEVQHPRAAV